MNYGRRFVTLYRRQGPRPSPWKRNANQNHNEVPLHTSQNGCDPKIKLVLKKAEEPEIKLPTSAGSWKKQESFRKTSISALLTMPKLLTVWITINCRKF